MAKTVYPSGLGFMPGVPEAPISTDAATARRLVASGAFTTEAPPDAGEPIELSDAARDALALFIPTTEPDAPAEPEV